MGPQLIALLLPLLKLIAEHAPEELAAVKKMFDKGIPTVEEIEAERARNAALTLDDATPPPATNG